MLASKTQSPNDPTLRGAFQRGDGRRHADAAGEEDDVLRQLLL